MTNINIEIPDKLHKKIKLNAVIEDMSLKEYIIKILNKVKRVNLIAYKKE